MDETYREPIDYCHGVTIDEEKVTDANIMATFKTFFCNRCYVYDCRVHDCNEVRKQSHPHQVDGTFMQYSATTS